MNVYVCVCMYSSHAKLLIIQSPGSIAKSSRREPTYFAAPRVAKWGIGTSRTTPVHALYILLRERSRGARPHSLSQLLTLSRCFFNTKPCSAPYDPGGEGEGSEGSEGSKVGSGKRKRRNGVEVGEKHEVKEVMKRGDE